MERVSPTRNPAFSLATLTEDGSKPSVRSVGMRSYLAAGDGSRSAPCLIFSTDRRTPKAKQLIAHPDCSLSTWAPAKLKQIRVTATAAVFGATGWETGSAGLGKELASVASEDWQARREAAFREETFKSRTRAWHSRGVPGAIFSEIDPEVSAAWVTELSHEVR